MIKKYLEIKIQYRGLKREITIPYDGASLNPDKIKEEFYKCAKIYYDEGYETRTEDNEINSLKPFILDYDPNTPL